MPELFIEIGVEEIPVAEINPAMEYLSNSIKQLFESERITFNEVKTFFTPRRLVLSVNGVSDKGEPSKTTYTGPRRDAAFDKDGNPTQAAIGFARSKGVNVESLQVVRLDKGEFVQVEINKPGVQTKTLIQERLRNIILSSPFRKSMRWGDGEKSSNNSSTSIRFIRPLRWLVVLYGGKVVPLTLGDVKTSSYTYGLRTGSGKKIRVNGVESWLKVMQKEKVLPDVAARKNSIMNQTGKMAQRVKGQAQPDAALLDTITNLVESPVAVLGNFDKRFMNLPEEVIMSVMKTHQKYIPVVDNRRALMPYFIGISNNPSGSKAIIKKGYERVLNARLEDAEFYYREDIKQPLEYYGELLKGMTFYPKLGSLYDKTQRIVNITSYLCTELKVDEALKMAALHAARLCKADLATRLVSEFPELQGIIGYQYVLVKNPSDRTTARAIAEQYDQPSTMTGALVYIADKIDSLVGFFSIGEVPTGTQDPYGLRRAVIGIINALLKHSIVIDITNLVMTSFALYNFSSLPGTAPSSQSDRRSPDKEAVLKFVMSFVYGRFKGILSDRYTTSTKLIDAVIATGPDNILEADQRVAALKDIVFKPEFEPIMLAFKRVMNISKGHVPNDVNPDLLLEPSEKALYDKYIAIHADVQSSLATRNYIGYREALEKLVPEINFFFDKVLVMSDDESVKTNRLNLLAKIKNLVMQVLDITKLT